MVNEGYVWLTGGDGGRSTRGLFHGGAPGHHIRLLHSHTTKYDVGSAKRRIIG
jgi:hypothetical protein